MGHRGMMGRGHLDAQSPAPEHAQRCRPWYTP
jgi:hypothetical protein